MATLIGDMVDQYFDHLGTKAAYTALGLNEFRRMDGNVLDWDRLDELRHSDLPAHAVGEVRMVNRVIAEPANIMWTVTADMALIYQAKGPLHEAPSAESEAALWVIMDILADRATRVSGIGGTTAISTYDFELTGVHPIRPSDTSRGFALWAYTWRVAMSKSRRASA